MSIMTILEQGQVQKSFDDAALAAGDGTVFALPAQAVLVTWQTSFVTPPSAVDISIQTSLDNISWSSVATTTATAGAIGSFVTSAVFIRAIVNSATDGDTFTVMLVSKNASLNSQQGISGSIDAGEVAFGIAGNAIAGDSAFQFNSTSKLVEFVSAAGLSFAGASNPITVVGGDDTVGDTAIIIDNPDDAYVVIYLPVGADFTFDSNINWYSNNSNKANYGIESGASAIEAGFINLRTNDIGVNTGASLLLGGASNMAPADSQLTTGGTLQIIAPVVTVIGDTTQTGTFQASDYKSGDGSAGIDTTITTASLVGKTITVKDGLITGFA